MNIVDYPLLPKKRSSEAIEIYVRQLYSAGESLGAIGRRLHKSKDTIKRMIFPEFAEKRRELTRTWWQRKHTVPPIVEVTRPSVAYVRCLEGITSEKYRMVHP
jgi:hypothetical protein